MFQKPPYTITEKTADYLTKIVESVTRLELGTQFMRDIKLHRENRVRTIHSSLAIEGNTLSLDEVTAVIEGKVVARRQEEIKGFTGFQTPHRTTADRGLSRNDRTG